MFIVALSRIGSLQSEDWWEGGLFFIWFLHLKRFHK